MSVFVDVLCSSSLSNGPVVKQPRQMGYRNLGRYSLGAKEFTSPLSWGVSSYPGESDSSSEKNKNYTLIMIMVTTGSQLMARLPSTFRVGKTRLKLKCLHQKAHRSSWRKTPESRVENQRT